MKTEPIFGAIVGCESKLKKAYALIESAINELKEALENSELPERFTVNSENACWDDVQSLQDVLNALYFNVDAMVTRKFCYGL